MTGQPGRRKLPMDIDDVEVSEVTLGDDEFTTAFGGFTTQFDDFDAEQTQPDDPWSSRRRLD